MPSAARVSLVFGFVLLRRICDSLLLLLIDKWEFFFFAKM
jgi:hypothetical protein